MPDTTFFECETRVCETCRSQTTCKLDHKRVDLALVEDPPACGSSFSRTSRSACYSAPASESWCNFWGGTSLIAISNGDIAIARTTHQPKGDIIRLVSLKKRLFSKNAFAASEFASAPTTIPPRAYSRAAAKPPIADFQPNAMPP